MSDELDQPPDDLPDELPAPPAGRIRLALVAPVSYAQGDEPKPIHALRTGTFTDSNGREATFSAEDIRGMAERLNAAAQKRRPPINEGHDYGRAVGRMLAASTKYGDNHLYITPRWNQSGQALLADEVYDGFSIELSQARKDGLIGAWEVIGGALTNYPAVTNLAPVTLEAPPPDIDSPPTAENPPMSDSDPSPPAAPDLPPLPIVPSDDPALAAQVAAYAAQIQAQFRQQHEAVLVQARQQALAEFERWKAEQAASQSVLAFAQHVTVATLARPHALSYTADQVVALLSGLSTEKRQAVQQLITDVVEGKALAAFDPIGSAGHESAADPQAEYQALVADKMRTGLSQVAALRAVNRERPDLYAAMSAPKENR